MALNATIFKVDLTVSDMDRSHYATHALVLARHPSETDERLMVRLLAFALNADNVLEFGKGLSSEDEPALWRKDLTGRVELWIDVGLPDEKSIRRACGRADQVLIYSYGRAAERWWQDMKGGLARPDNLKVIELPAVTTQTMAELAQRTMQLQCTVQDGTAWLTDGAHTVEIAPVLLRAAR
ncbi:MAG: YaeQ family protein [Burkholderiales bacterium]|nr:YaeQ family protein [Burkholderiales bacterium]MDP2396876.1 YaeQ family protein [Burkholderiales bacterium]